MQRTSGSRWSFNPLANAWRAESCLKVHLPCWRASWQLERMWWIVGRLLSFHTVDSWSRSNSLHYHILSGVGRVAGVPAVRRKHNWPAGRPLRTLWLAFSSSVTDSIFVCTDRSFWFMNYCCGCCSSLNISCECVTRMVSKLPSLRSVTLSSP